MPSAGALTKARWAGAHRRPGGPITPATQQLQQLDTETSFAAFLARLTPPGHAGFTHMEDGHVLDLGSLYLLATHRGPSVYLSLLTRYGTQPVVWRFSAVLPSSIDAESEWAAVALASLREFIRGPLAFLYAHARQGDTTAPSTPASHAPAPVKNPELPELLNMSAHLCTELAAVGDITDYWRAGLHQRATELHDKVLDAMRAEGPLPEEVFARPSP